eukprot:gene35234-43449_t
MITQADILNAKILIVDDQAVNVQLLEYLLTTTGYTAVSSTTDPRVVAPWHEQHNYDLIILDLHMPGMSGFDVMNALKPLEAEAYLPVLVVTAQPDHKLAALEAGARDFVSKPFDPVEVLTRIRNMLEVRLMHRESKNYSTLLEQTVRERTAELQRFRSAMDATADAIFLIDTATLALVDVNDGACRMLGYARPQLLALEPERIGLGARDSLQLHCNAAMTTVGTARAPELVETELTRQDLAAVPVELYWQLQQGGGFDQPGPLPPDPNQASEPPQTLLIVDDDVNVLSSLHRLFRRDGYRILTAATPAEGFELLALYPVQVIVCDQRMPIMSGTEFLSKVKEMYPDTIRIILSGYTGLEAVLDSINRGAIYRFYTKPWDDIQLRDNIRLAFHHYWLMHGTGRRVGEPGEDHTSLA